MASETLHEPIDKLNPETINIHRAIVSLMEELEAIDWYRQRADACTDAQLHAILEHNMNEEIEHASMVIEWIRRNLHKFDEALKTYLFLQETSSKLKKQPMAARSNRLRLRMSANRNDDTKRS